MKFNEESVNKISSLLICISIFFVMQDGTLLYIFLPDVQNDYQTDMSKTIWLMNGYILPFALCMPIFGILSQRIGANRIFLLGILLFAIGSLSGIFSSTFSFLVLSRSLQGIGSSIIIPVSLVLLLRGKKKVEYTKIIGIWGGIGALAASIGPLFGGLIGEIGHWKWIFMINFFVFLLILFVCYVIFSKIATTNIVHTRSIRVVLKKPIVLFTMLFNFAAGFILNSVLYVEPFILSDYIDSTFGISLVIVPLCVAVLSAAVVIRKLEHKLKLSVFTIIGAVFILCGLSQFIFQSMVFFVMISAVANLLIGFGLGLVIISSTSKVMLELEIDFHSFASSIINMFRLLGAVIGSSISSQIFHSSATEEAGNALLSFYSLLLLPVLLIILIYIYQQYWQRKQGELSNLEQKM